MQKLNEKLSSFGFDPKIPQIKLNADSPYETKIAKEKKSDSEMIDDMFGTSG